MIKNIRNYMKNEKGMILPTLMILMIAFTTVGLALTSYTTSQLRQTKDNVYIANALQVAEAGIEQSLYQINQDESFAGYATEQEFFNDEVQGRGVYSTTVTTTADSNAKVITSTGKVFRQSNPSEPVSTKKVKVTIVGTNSEGYSVHTGPGGLIVRSGASITNSDIYVNGRIQMNGGARIGTESQPLNINVAHYACPDTSNPGPAYPQLCTSGQPITFENGNRIYGTICATGQTRTSNPNSGSTQILPGIGGEGLKPNCVAPQVATPAFNKAAQVSAVTTTGAGNGNAYGYCNWPYKDHIWPDKLKLTGNVKIDSDCKVTIKGDVYITGDFDLTGGAKIYIDNSVGARRPNIIVDGAIRINSPGGGGAIITNNLGTGAHFISFKSNASCGSNCTSLTGTELKNAQNFETVTVEGGTSFPGMVFQSYWGKIRVSAGGNVGAAVGQTVDLNGGGAITFGTILSSGTRSWTISSYQQVFD